MKPNPYAPPAASLQADEIAFLRESVPRPIAVWLFVGMLLIMVALVVVRPTSLLVRLSFGTNSYGGLPRLALYLATSLAVGGGLAFLAISAYRGVPWSRWISVAVVVLLVLVTLVRPDTTFYATEAERTGGFVGRYILVPLLVAWWIYAFAFSRKAKRFFMRSTERGT